MRSAGRGNSPFLFLCFFPPEVQALPWVAPLSSREGFLISGCFVWGSVGLLPASLFSCLAPALPTRPESGGVALFAPSLAFLNPLPCQLPNAEGEPEHHTVWRTWRWGFSSCTLHPALSFGHVSVVLALVPEVHGCPEYHWLVGHSQGLGMLSHGLSGGRGRS